MVIQGSINKLLTSVGIASKIISTNSKKEDIEKLETEKRQEERTIRAEERQEERTIRAEERAKANIKAEEELMLQQEELRRSKQFREMFTEGGRWK